MNKNTEQTLVLSFEDVDIHSQQKRLFENLNLKVQEGEHLMLVGSSGSGKTALLKAVEGRFYVSKGKITRHFYENYIQQHVIEDPLFSFTNLIATVPEQAHFKNTSNTDDLYYQQRYNSSDSEDALPVHAYLNNVFRESLVESKKWNVSEVLELLMLTHLADKEIIKLSNGETKRLLIAAALVKSPSLLLMDNPMVGLDSSTRNIFDDILAAIINSGITIIMTGSPNLIPAAVTHIGILKDGQIRQIRKDAFDQKELEEKNSSGAGNGFNDNLFRDLLEHQKPAFYNYIVKLKNAFVKYGDNVILNNVNWSIRQGERWVVSGPNGSGKTTLLSLLNGDNPQVYANDVILFDRKRGTGESIWEIKQKIGFVSPELHQYFPEGNTCLQVIESGFYDTQGLFRKSDPAKRASALRWMEVFHLSAHASEPYRNISASEQRLVLLARALVKNPPLLILDEPCQGLDEPQQIYFRTIIEELCGINHTTVIYVTHHREEIPSGFELEYQLNPNYAIGFSNA